MRKNPINYLTAFAIAAGLWIILGIFVGDSIGDSIILATLSVEEFLNLFRILLGILALLSILMVLYWFYYGNKTSTAGELDKAKKKYTALFIAEVIFAAAMIVVMIIMLMDEGVAGSDYAYMLVLACVLTFVFFWLVTLILSPKTVKFIPFFAKKIF